MKLRYALYVLMSLGCAQAQAAPDFASGKSNVPIEISADALEVQQEKNIAVFTGNVVAIQDKMRLKSDKMTVYYRENGEKKQAGQDAIRKIEVEGNVFMTTPEETASGLSGVYDVEKQHITLHNQVVLTRGKNTLKGDELVYDMKTGKSSVTAGVTNGSQDGKVKQRVRALFVPDGEEKKSR